MVCGNSLYFVGGLLGPLVSRLVYSINLYNFSMIEHRVILENPLVSPQCYCLSDKSFLLPTYSEKEAGNGGQIDIVIYNVNGELGKVNEINEELNE